MRASSPAVDLIVECARSPMSMNPAIPAGDLDWDEVLRFARPNGMEPLLFRCGTKIGHDRFPPEVWARIVQAQEENARRSLEASIELLAIVRELEDAGISAVTYKGPVLAQQLYGDVAARRFADLDIMVRPSQVRAARGVLESGGYVTDLALPGWQLDEYVRIQKEIAFIHRNTLQEVDLQWTVTERSFGLRWDLRGMWARATPFDFAGRSVRTFEDNDLALILLVHGTTHLWERLAWIADLGRLVSTRDVEWLGVVRAARELRAERMVLTSLALADLITGCGVPQRIAPLITAKHRNDADRLRERVLSAPAPRLGDPERPFHLMLVRLRDGSWDRARYASSLAVTPTVGDWEAVPLPRALRLLYVLIRPIRLIGRYAYILLRGRPR